MTAWDTTDDDVDAFVDGVARRAESRLEISRSIQLTRGRFGLL